LKHYGKRIRSPRKEPEEKKEIKGNNVNPKQGRGGTWTFIFKWKHPTRRPTRQRKEKNKEVKGFPKGGER